MEVTLLSSSPDDTRAIGGALASMLEPGDVIVLSGDLGAGKTCLVQGAAAARGVRARVTSPSFVLVREYAGDVGIVHVDVYRLNNLSELEDLGYEDVFDPGRIAFVEWGDAVAGALPQDRVTVEMTRLADDRRRIVVRAPSGRDLAPALRAWVEP